MTDRTKRDKEPETRGPWGLRFEIVTSLVILVAAAAGLMGLLVFKYAQREMVALKLETGVVLVRALQDRLQQDRSVDGLRGLALALSETGFEHLVVVDRSGQVVITSRSWTPEDDRKIPELREAMAGRRMTTRLGEPHWLPLGPDPTLTITAPLIQKMETIGAVGLYSTLPEIREGWRQAKWLIAIYLVLDTLIVVAFGTYLLSRRLVEPLRRLARRFEDFAEGRYEPGSARANPNNEIGRLESAFEDMAGRLGMSQEQLEDSFKTLKTAQDSLIRSEKMASVGRLAAGLAHELGNPMGSLLGFVHLLKLTDVSETERSDYLGRMESELRRMDGIIRSLLDYARPRPVCIERVDINRVVRDALGLAGVQKWRAGLEIVTELSPEDPLVKGETNRLIQVLINLLTNAGQAMAGKGRLTVGARSDGDKVLVTVSDTGTGISSSDLPHIFEPFFTSKDPGQGTGLGLSVSQSIVEAFGGRIEVESRPGQGSTFTVVLERKQDDHELA